MAEFPFDKETWDNMITRMHEKISQENEPEDAEKIKLGINDILENETSQAPVPYPRAPIFTRKMTVEKKIDTIQNYLNQLQYNHTGTQFFVVKMNRSISRLYQVAKDIIRNPLPIKCLEAVAVALYLTAPIQQIHRFTIRFKSQYGKTIHRHIVLGIHHNQTYGAVGLSRRSTLMYKPLRYKSLLELIMDFRESYEDCCHRLLKVKLSLPVTSDLHTCGGVVWDYFVLHVSNLSKDGLKSGLQGYLREFRTRCC